MFLRKIINLCEIECGESIYIYKDFEVYFFGICLLFFISEMMYKGSCKNG